MQPGLQTLETLYRDSFERDYRNKGTIGLHISAKNPSKMHLFKTVAMETENNFAYTAKD